MPTPAEGAREPVSAPRTVNATLQTAIAFAVVVVLLLTFLVAVTPSRASAEEPDADETVSLATESASDTEDEDADSAVADEPAHPTSPSDTPDSARPSPSEPESESEKPKDEDSKAPDSAADTPEETTATTSETPSEDAEEDEAVEAADILSRVDVYTGAVHSRSRRARAAGAADPRFQCGMDIALLLDTSRSTAPYQETLRSAASLLVANLAGTGSKLTIVTFNRQATTILPKTELDEAGSRAAQAAIQGAQWAASDRQSGSNYAGAFEAAQSQNVNATIVVGDGVPVLANRTQTTSTVGSTFTEDTVNSYNAAQLLRESGSALFSVAQQRSGDAKVYAQWKDAPSNALNERIPDVEPLVPGVYVTSELYNYNGKANGWRSVDPRREDIITTPEGRKVRLKVNGREYPLFTTRQINGRDFLAGFSDDVIDTRADFSDLSERINSLSDGCWGTVTVRKEIVNNHGEVQTNHDLSGFEFVADKALNGDRVQNNYTMGTNAEGEAVFHYPTRDGSGSMTVRENPRDGYTIVEQSVDGATTLARCTAVEQGGRAVPVSYGSGNGIVVTSDAAQQSFRLTGVGTQHRVECVVQNSKGEPTFELAKSPTHGDQTYPLASASGTTVTAEYTVEVFNTGGAGGAAPDLREKPSAPPGLRVSAVSVHPEGENPLVDQPQQLSRGSDGAWILASNQMRPVDAGQKRHARVAVEFTVDQPEQITADNLRCTPGDSTKGLINRVELSAPTDQAPSAEACITATLPKVALVKTINGEDADTKEEAAAIMSGTDTVTVDFTFRNTGSTPLTHFRLSDSALNPETGAKEGSIEMPDLRCIGAEIRKDGDGYLIIPSRAINANEAVSCSWLVGSPIVPEPGEYHGDRGLLEAHYVIPGVPGDQVPRVTDENDAWLFTLPVAVGTLPDSGGHGHGHYLLIGGLVAALGALLAYRRRA